MSNRYALVKAFCLLLCASCESDVERQIPGDLKRFYISYMATMEKLPLHQKFSRDTLQKYFTASFLKRIPGEIERCDCDPITRTQDYNGEYMKTVTVDPLSVGERRNYSLCYREYMGKKSCLVVVVVKDKGEWKIDEVGDGGN